ncbi:MAG: OsmC family protein, partial [Actinomycetes bacterium]
MSVTETARRRNGVDVETLFATLDAVRAQPQIARFQFRSAHRWVSGTHNQGSISGFYGAGQEHLHERETVIDADHPAVLVGADHGPTPAELLLNALGACLMSGLANIAAA